MPDRAEKLSGAEVHAIDRSSGLRWEISVTGGRERIYGPDTPAGVGAYITVVPLSELEAAEKALKEVQQRSDDLLEAKANAEDACRTVYQATNDPRILEIVRPFLLATYSDREETTDG